MMAGPVLNAFTVDVEDFYQVSAFERFIPHEAWETYPQRAGAGVRRLLELLAEHGVRGTFFILGWIAQRHPDWVREIVAAGHEIGFHSASHRLIYTQTPEEFRHELRVGKAFLEDLTGVEVEAFRAPSFSITEKSLWALEVLAECGFRYDSSIFPVHHDRYGIPGARADIHLIDTPSGGIWEFPPSVLTLGCGRWTLNLPVAGGGYFRLYPWWFSKMCLKNVVRKGRRPFVFYVHPWEVDPEQPRLPFGSCATQFRHRVGLGRNLDKLHKLLREFSFSTLSGVINHENSGDSPRSG